MMDTVLNLGLNDRSVEGLAKQSERRRPLRPRRLPPVHPDVRQDRDGRARRGVRGGARPREGAQGRGHPGHRPRRRRPHRADRGVPRRSTGRTRARSSRRTRRSSCVWRSRRCSSRGTASGPSTTGGRTRSPTTSARRSTSQAMVFGNRGDDSGTGVAFTRDPSKGEKVPYGDYLANAQGEDVVAGIRNTLPLVGARGARPRRRTRGCASTWTRSRGTTATCATSSSRSRSGSSGSSRSASASGRRSPSG